MKMNEQQTVKDALPPGLDASFLDHLTQQLEAGANAKAIFGDPVERNGTTIIPVARARWGVGGGSGMQPNSKAAGTGGGGGVIVAPVGFIEICEGRAKFKPIRSQAFPLLLVIGAAAICLSAVGAVQIALSRPQSTGRRSWTRR